MNNPINKQIIDYLLETEHKKKKEAKIREFFFAKYQKVFLEFCKSNKFESDSNKAKKRFIEYYGNKFRNDLEFMQTSMKLCSDMKFNGIKTIKQIKQHPEWAEKCMFDDPDFQDCLEYYDIK